MVSTKFSISLNKKYFSKNNPNLCITFRNFPKVPFLSPWCFRNYRHAATESTIATYTESPIAAYTESNYSNLHYSNLYYSTIAL